MENKHFFHLIGSLLFFFVISCCSSVWADGTIGNYAWNDADGDAIQDQLKAASPMLP